MSDRRASAASDRLPWLDEEPKGSTRRWSFSLARWAPALAVIAVIVAAGSYWLGRQTGRDQGTQRPVEVTDIGKDEATMSLPDARKAVEEIAAKAPPLPEATAEAHKPAPPPPVVRHGRVDIRRSRPAARPEGKDGYWPATSSVGASGRMVRIGTFATRAAAKKGWRAIMDIYPGMRRIPTAVVASPSARDQVIYYRLQMGTTSQAHSEVLCQRMRIIGQSCVVIGLKGASS